VDRLLEALAHGLTLKQACIASGISESTLGDWRDPYAELEARLAQAREQARQKALAGIKAAGEAGDWQALEAFLRMSFQADYRRASNASVEVNTALQTQAVVCTEEQRMRLIEQRNRILRLFGGDGAAAGGDQNCAVVAGLRQPFRFTNMNRHKQQTPEKPNRKQTRKTYAN